MNIDKYLANIERCSPSIERGVQTTLVLSGNKQRVSSVSRTRERTAGYQASTEWLLTFTQLLERMDINFHPTMPIQDAAASLAADFAESRIALGGGGEEEEEEEEGEEEGEKVQPTRAAEKVLGDGKQQGCHASGEGASDTAAHAQVRAQAGVSDEDSDDVGALPVNPSNPAALTRSTPLTSFSRRKARGPR